MVVGQTARDLVLQVERIPAAGSAAPATQRLEMLGGKGANQAVGLVQLGCGQDLPGSHGICCLSFRPVPELRSLLPGPLDCGEAGFGYMFLPQSWGCVYAAETCAAARGLVHRCASGRAGGALQPDRQRFLTVS